MQTESAKQVGQWCEVDSLSIWTLAPPLMGDERAKETFISSLANRVAGNPEAAQLRWFWYGESLSYRPPSFGGIDPC